DRKKLTLSGVLEVVNFDDEKISLNTILGNLAIKGEGLKMNKLDVQNGDVIIMGYISSMIYSGKDGKKSKESIIKKIFK
ncbi:MAG: sporulation protein YabP, partial [Clostridium butyricum]